MNRENDYLAHHGVKGQKWGVRRYQNADGSYTVAGRSRYGVGDGKSYHNLGNSKEGKSNKNGSSGKKKGLSKGQKIAIGVGVGVGAAAAAYGVSAAVRGRRNAKIGLSAAATAKANTDALKAMQNGSGIQSHEKTVQAANDYLSKSLKNLSLREATKVQMTQDGKVLKAKAIELNNKLANTKINKIITSPASPLPAWTPAFRYKSDMLSNKTAAKSYAQDYYQYGKKLAGAGGSKRTLKDLAGAAASGKVASSISGNAATDKIIKDAVAQGKTVKLNKVDLKFAGASKEVDNLTSSLLKDNVSKLRKAGF